jgi:hypothetical protein
MGTGSFPGVRRSGRGADPSTTIFNAEVLNNIRARPLPALRALVACVGEPLSLQWNILDYYCIIIIIIITLRYRSKLDETVLSMSLELKNFAPQQIATIPPMLFTQEYL